MAHFILEYTDNLKAEGDIRGLLAKVVLALRAQEGVFPIGGIRARAIELTDYVVADDEEDYAFAHATLKIGSGRSDEVRKATYEAVFDAMKAHFADIYAKRYLALSMEVSEFSEAGTFKHNNIHARFKARS